MAGPGVGVIATDEASSDQNSVDDEVVELPSSTHDDEVLRYFSICYVTK